MIDPYRAMLWAYYASVLFAAGYFVTMRRRSRRAAGVGLAAATLLGLAFVMGVSGFGYEWLLQAVGIADGQTRNALRFWLNNLHWAGAEGLLVWAVVADRQPPAGE